MRALLLKLALVTGGLLSIWSSFVASGPPKGLDQLLP